MKRFICLLMAFTMLFSFASCSVDKNTDGETATTTAPPPDVKEVTESAEFKDESGRVVFTVDVVLPEISKNAEQKTIDYVNRTVSEIFENACTFAENNIENASNYMDNFGSSTPWSKKITFEATYLSGRYVCFLMKEAFSSTGAEDIEPMLSTLCFDIAEGVPCDAMYFAADPEARTAITQNVRALVQNKALSDFYSDGMSLTNEQLELIAKVFTLDNFYITEEGMGFYFERNYIDQNLSGEYRCVIPWADLEGIFIRPETV